MDRDSVLPHIKKIPGPKARQWAAFHLKYASKATYEPEFIWDRTRAAIGPFCTDVDGNILMDFVSHVGSSPLGYNNPEIMEMIGNINQADPDRYAGSDFICAYGDSPKHSRVPTPSHLHHKMIEITKQFGFKKAYFSNTGAEAVENAIKLCYDARENNGYGICFQGAFHGRSLGALSFNRSKTVQRKWYPQVPKTIDLHYCSEQHGEHGHVIGRHGQPIFPLRELMEGKRGVIDPEEVAFILMEPVQGEGGYRIPNQAFIKDVYKVAHEHNIPIISDEIQAGMGRTGKWWACEHFNVKPDMITAAKALRIGATIGREEYFPVENGRISSTWGEGNFMASAIGHKTIEIIQKHRLLHHVEKMGSYFMTGLHELMHRSAKLTDVRGLGLMCAMEFRELKQRDAFTKQCLKRGLLLIGCGYKSVRFLPPLDINMRECDLALDIMNKALKKI